MPRRCTTLWAISAVSLLFISFVSMPGAQEVASPSAAVSVSEIGPNAGAVLTPGSELTITVWTGKAVHVFTRARVAEGGTVTLPRLGAVSVGGRNLQEALTVILDAYRAIYPDCSVDLVPVTLRAPRQPLFEDRAGAVAGDGSHGAPGTDHPATTGAIPAEPIGPGPTAVNPAEVYAMLPRFGADAFLNPRLDTVALTAAATEGGERHPGSPLANVPVPVSYEIGPGDELKVEVWSQNTLRSQTQSVVSADGAISIPLLGQVVVAGNTRGGLAGELSAQLTRYYTEPRVVIELLRQRTVEVFVSGSVSQPGRYVLPPNATVLTALYAAGGPSEIGSYRHVRLLRADGTDAEIDLYDYLMYGRRAADEALATGDRLFVPGVRAEVGVAGLVRCPARFEVEAPVTLDEVLRMASGFRPNAYAAGIEVWRSERFTEWHLITADATVDGESGREMVLRDGDLVKVGALVDEAFNAVEVRGPVHRPGMYQVTGGLTVGGVIRLAQGPTPAAYMDEAVIWRLNDRMDYELVRFSVRGALGGGDDPPVQARDIVHIYLDDEVRPTATVRIEGAIARPQALAFVEGIRVRDLVLASGDLLPGAYTERAEVLRIAPDRKTQIVSVNLAEALAGAVDHNIALQRGDTVRVLLRSDVTGQSLAHIAGLVRNPGSYARHEGMKVSDLIVAAGGLQPSFGDVVYHTPGRHTGLSSPQQLRIEGAPDSFTVSPDIVLADDDHIGVMGRADFIAVPEIAQVQGRVTSPGTYALRAAEPDDAGTTDTIYDLLQRAGGLLPDANPRGIILYRLREEVLPRASEEELNYVLSILNREASVTSAALENGEQAEILSTVASDQVGGLLGTDYGALVVVPPRRIGIAQWIKAVPIDGALLLETEGREGNMALRPGDVVRVPKAVDFVTVIGSVNSPQSVPYAGAERPARYVDMAGGPTDDAAMKRIIVMRANGATLPAERATVVEPGDVIIVPSEHMFRTKRVGAGWADTLRSLLSIAAAAVLF